jgi:hypothetical protein
LIVALSLIDRLSRHGNFTSLVTSRSTAVRWPIYCSMLLSIIFLGKFSSASFIYFQF